MKKTAIALLSAFFLMAGSALAAETVKIGVMGPMTGQWASEGQGMKEIISMMADDLNASGGVAGNKIEVIIEDDGGDPRTATLAAQKLSTKGVVAVVGTYGSSITEATQNIYDEAGIIQVGTGSTANNLTEKGLKLFFRTAPRNDEQSNVAAKAITAAGYKNIAILHDNTSFAKSLAEESKTIIEKAGVKVAFFDALTPGERDYSAILTKIKAINPDAIFYTGYYPEAGLLLRQKMEMNFKVPVIGSDATNNPDLVKIAGTPAAEGFSFVSAPVPQDLATPEAKDFMAKFTKKYGKAPASIYAVLAGDAFKAITEAIKGTSSTDPKKMAEYMHTKLKNMKGLTGDISFDEKGDRVGSVYKVYKVDAKGNFLMQP